MDINAIKGVNLDTASVGQTGKQSKGDSSFDFSNLVSKSQSGVDANKSITSSAQETSKDTYDQYSYRKNEVPNASADKLKNKISDKTEKVEEYNEKAVKEVSESLDVSEEEVVKAMEILGLTALDLQNPQNLAELVSKITGEPTTNLILSSDFQELMGRIDDLGKQLMNELDLPLEQLEDVQEAFVQVKNTESIVQEEEADETKDTVKTIHVSEELKTVEKTSDTNSSVEVINNRRGMESGNDSGMLQGGMSNQNFASENMMTEVAVEPVTEFTYTSDATLELISKVADNVRVLLETDTTSMEMQLNPENLGKIYLNVSSKEGAVNATIAAQNEDIKNALEMQVATLRENLNQAGIKVDAIEVTIASHEFERNLEQNEQQQQNPNDEEQSSKGRKNISLDSLDELSGVMSEEEMLVAQIMKDNGNSVDFTA